MSGVLFPLILAALLSSVQAAPSLPVLRMDAFPPAARETLSRAQQRAAERPADVEAAGAFARALHAWEQWESAHAVYLRAQTLAPRAFEWHYLDGVVLQRLARHDDAARQFREAVSAKPEYLPARLKLAEALLEAGAFPESQRLLDALVREPLAEAAARVALGRIAAADGKHADAVAHFERAVSLFPALGAAHYGLARSYRALGRAADAERAIARHVQYGPQWPRLDDPVLAAVITGRDDAAAVLREGVASAAAGDVEAAITAHETALQRDPSLVHVHANLLSLYGRVKNWAKAEEHYRAALAAGFAPADLHYDYGVIATLQEKYDVAEAAYRRALAANPLHANAHNNLAQLLERQATACARTGGAVAACAPQFQQVIAEYRQAVTSQPSLRVARFNLGRMLLAVKQPEEARREFEQLQQPRDADTPRYLFALATAHVHAGRRAEGIRIAGEAQRLAIEFGQTDLAEAIARDLAALK
jgi:tetratricopeptide (TPR) repeat protein